MTTSIHEGSYDKELLSCAIMTVNFYQKGEFLLF